MVAAPILKLCLLNCASSRPALLRAARRCDTRYARVSGVPDWRGPGDGERAQIYCTSVLTVQVGASVRPRKTSTPCRKGSVVLCFMQRLAMDGSAWLSSASVREVQVHVWVVCLRGGNCELPSPEKTEEHRASSCPEHDAVRLQRAGQR